MDVPEEVAAEFQDLVNALKDADDTDTREVIKTQIKAKAEKLNQEGYTNEISENMQAIEIEENYNLKLFDLYEALNHTNNGIERNALNAEIKAIKNGIYARKRQHFGGCRLKHSA